MKKLTFLLSLFLGCLWLFGYIDNSKIYSQERPELFNKFFTYGEINDLLSDSQRQRTPRKKHDRFRSSHISRNFQGANGATVWVRTYGGGGEDGAHSIQQTSDGGYIVAGKTRSFDGTKAWILKLRSDGKIEWQNTYSGGFSTHANLVQQTSDGGYIVAGLTGSFGDPDFKDIWVLKLSSHGDIEWQRAYGGSSYESDWNHGRHRVTLLETSDKGYILAGDTQSFGAGWSDIWLLKLSSLGDIEWQKTYGGQEGETLYRCGPNIQLTSDGGYIIGGDTLSFGAGGVDIWLLKLYSDGSIEWQRTYGGEIGDKAHSIQLTSDGGYIVAGSTNSFGLGGLDFFLLKLSSLGDIEWQHTYGGEDDDEAKCLYHTNDGGYILAGSTMSFGVGEEDILIFKVPPNGELGLSPNLVGNSIVMVSDTSVVPADTSIIPIITTALARVTDITVENTSVISELLSWNLNQPPMNVSLKREVNRSLFRGEAFNTISWSPNPANSSFVIAEYRVYRKDDEDDEEYQLIDSVSGNTLAYVDDYLDLADDFVYVVTSVDSDGNESPRSAAASTIDSINTTESSNTTVLGTSTSSSDNNKVKVTRKDTKVPSQPKTISKDILVSSTLRYNSPDKSQTLIQPPANVSFIRGEASQTIHWKHREQNVAEYRIYRKYAGEDDESYMLIGSVPGNVQAYAVYASSTDEKLIFTVTAVDVNSNESEKSKPIKN